MQRTNTNEVVQMRKDWVMYIQFLKIRSRTPAFTWGCHSKLVTVSDFSMTANLYYALHPFGRPHLTKRAKTFSTVQYALSSLPWTLYILSNINNSQQRQIRLVSIVCLPASELDHRKSKSNNNNNNTKKNYLLLLLSSYYYHYSSTYGIM